MKLVTLLPFAFIVCIAYDSKGQDKSIQNIRWKSGGWLPKNSAVEKHIGLAGPLVGIINDVLLIGGGANFPFKAPWEGGAKVYYNKLHLYSLFGDTLRCIDTHPLPSNIAYCCSVPTHKGLLYAGGENERGLSNHVFLLDLDSEFKMNVVELPPLPVALTNASAIAYKTKVYVAGGESSEGTSDLIYSLDLDNVYEGWRLYWNLPKPLSHFSFLALDSHSDRSLYVIGGRCKTSTGVSLFSSAVYKLDIDKREWNIETSLDKPVSASTAVAVNGQLLLLGGDEGSTFNKVEKIIKDINSCKDPSSRQALNISKAKLLMEHPGFSRKVQIYSPQYKTWKYINQLPFDGQVTTTAVVYKGKIIIPSGEIRAGVRTPMITLGEVVIN